MGARLVGRGGYHATFGRIAIAAHHHGPPTQLGMAKHLDRGDELVEVHVQYPEGHTSVSPGRLGFASTAPARQTVPDGGRRPQRCEPRPASRMSFGSRTRQYP